MKYKSALILIIILLSLSCATTNSINSSALQKTTPIQSKSKETIIPIRENKNSIVKQILKEEGKGHIKNAVNIGDLISITTWGHPNMSGVARIEKDGKLYLPLIGGIYAKGLTIEQLKNKLTEAYTAYIKNPIINVEVKEYASRLVLLFGSVTKPGIYPVKEGTDLVTALAMAGWRALRSNLSSIYLLRNGHSTIVNLADYLRTGNRYNDPILKNKDVIYVPSAKEQNVLVLGQVNKPALIPLSTAPVSIVKAIVLAGGFKLGALRNDVKVIRGGLIHPSIYTVNLYDILHGKKPNSPQGLELYAGDIVFIPRNAITSWNDILKQIQPTLDFLLTKPLSIATNYLLLRELLRRP